MLWAHHEEDLHFDDIDPGSAAETLSLAPCHCGLHHAGSRRIRDCRDDGVGENHDDTLRANGNEIADFSVAQLENGRRIDH